MERLSEGDRVRIDIPDETDPDHSQYHGKHGTVVAIIEDHAGKVTGNEQDSALIRVHLESGSKADFRRRDVCPPIE